MTPPPQKKMTMSNKASKKKNTKTMGHLLYLSNLSAKTDDLVVPQVGIEGPRNVVPNVDRYPESPLRRNEETLAMHFSQKKQIGSQHQ